MTQEDLAKKILSETVVSLSQAGSRFPAQRGNGHTDTSTILRWIDKGVRLRDGGRLRLEAVRVGGRWLTSVEAMVRFVAAQTPGHEPEQQTPIETPNRRRRAANKAAEALDAIGI